MPALSAADAISPAIQRTRSFLFRPFRWGTYLKLCLVALLTEGLGGNSHFSGPGRHTSHHDNHFAAPFQFTPERMIELVAMVALIALIGLAIFYFITRLRFAYFHCLIHNTREIRPGWNLYRTQASRFFWMNIGVGIGFVLFVVLVALVFGTSIWRVVRDAHSSGHLDVGALLALVLPLIPILLLVVLAAFATDLILRDFMLPHYALENATAGQAWAAAWDRMTSEKASFFIYALLRIVLPIIGVIVLFAILVIPGIVFVGATALIEVGIHSAFADATGAAVFFGIFLQVLIGFIAFVVALVVGMAFGGPLSTAIREYALIFYAGRYRPLGDIMFPLLPPSPPAPAVP